MKLTISMNPSRRVKVLAAIVFASAITLTGCSTGSLSGGSSSGTTAKITTDGVGTQSDIGDITKYCGTKKMTVAMADGFGGNSWRKITKQVFLEDVKKCKNLTAVYTDAQGDTQKAISDINSLVAQKVDVIVTFVDGGQALLPTIKKATAAGVKVVPFVGSPGGVPGKDYTDFVAEDIKTYGGNLADWTIKAMGGKGNLVMLGGIAGNSYSQGVYDGVVAAAKKNPGIKLLNTDGPVATDWEPGKTQQVVAGLITKYGTIDGIVSDYGGGSVGGIRAFLAANQPIPPWSANDSNQFSCLWYQYKDTEPSYQIATESSRNWIVQEALNKGLAAANGIDNSEPSTFNLQIIEDSTDSSKQPNCQKSLPDDAILSSGLTVPQLQDLFK